MNLLTLFSGKRTYIVVALGLLYVFGGDQGWWKVRTEITTAVTLAAIAFLRAGVKPVEPEPQKDDARQTKLPLSILIAALLVGVMPGCSFSRIERGDFHAWNSRLLWQSEGFEFETRTNGTTRIRLQKSNPDAESLKAVAEGAARGATK